MERYALVTGARSSREVSAYLPGNYRIETTREVRGPGSRIIPAWIIAGEDSAGWTLEDYVIPRFASGLMTCEEIPAP